MYPTTQESSEESEEEFIFRTTATPTISNTTTVLTTTNPKHTLNVADDDSQYDEDYDGKFYPQPDPRPDLDEYDEYEYDGKVSPLRDLHRERFKTDILVRS